MALESLRPLLQYTFIMLASKAVPKQCVDYLSGKVKTRRSIGVRMPADTICQVAHRTSTLLSSITHVIHKLSEICWTCYQPHAAVFIAQVFLEQLERPLLCSSIRPEDQLSGSLPDAAVLLDEFGPRGLDFIVDDGRQVGRACGACQSRSIRSISLR
jgi:tRNA A37 threonylcarbamoyladenosine synthetase subunit TsaC/SUA5/YrdC